MAVAETLDWAARGLLQAPSVAPAAPAELPDCATPDDDQSQHLGLRVGGLFIILFVSSLGLVVPLLGKRFGSALFLARTFGAGVILATALVHVLADALGDLQNPCLGLSTEYPWAMAIASYAALGTFCAEYGISRALRARYLAAAPHHPEAALGDVELQPDSLAAEKLEAQRRLDATVTSYTLEAGIILHSVFVGLAYGASTDLETIRALTIALGFHQGIEAISLGCTFLDAQYSKLKYFLFGLAFALVTPLGIAIGLGVGNAYHEGSKAALGTQGTLNAVAGGILIYNALVDLLVPAFYGHGGHSHDGPQHAERPRHTALTLTGMAMLFLGAGLQDMIGKWA